MGEDLFFGNIITPIFALLIILGIYTEILDIDFIKEIRWEIITILTISILSLLAGIGTGAHIVSVSIERAKKMNDNNETFNRILYFFHWPFGHIASVVPSLLIVYLLILLDLFKGKIFLINDLQILILSVSGVALGLVLTGVTIATHITRMIYYTLLVISFSILLVLGAESITLLEHGTAYFFSLTFITTTVALGIYRNVHLISKSIHNNLQSRFVDGEKIG